MIKTPHLSGDYSYAAGDGSVLELVFEADRDKGLDQLGSTVVTSSAFDSSDAMDLAIAAGLPAFRCIKQSECSQNDNIVLII